MRFFYGLAAFFCLLMSWSFAVSLGKAIQNNVRPDATDLPLMIIGGLFACGLSYFAGDEE